MQQAGEMALLEDERGCTERSADREQISGGGLDRNPNGAETIASRTTDSPMTSIANGNSAAPSCVDTSIPTAVMPVTAVSTPYVFWKCSRWPRIAVTRAPVCAESGAARARPG